MHEVQYESSGTCMNAKARSRGPLHMHLADGLSVIPRRLGVVREVAEHAVHPRRGEGAEDGLGVAILG